MELYHCQTEKLKDYKGVGNAPEDYDEYWSRAKKEMEAMPVNYRLVPAEFKCASAETYDLYFTGTGGAIVHCQFLRPKSPCPEKSSKQKKLPAVVMFHGYWTNSGDWSGKLGYISEGYAVLAMDVRGQGGTSFDNGVYRGNTQSGHIIRGLEDDSPDKLFYRNVFLDTAQAVKVLASMDDIDSSAIFATGASQGGALTVACAALSPIVKAVAPVYPYLCDFQGVYQNSFSGSTYEEMTWFFRQRDPTHQNEDFFFNRLGYIDLKNITKYITCDVLWFCALSDNICPPFAQMAAYNGIKSKKEVVWYPEYSHEWLPFSGDKILDFFREHL
ncbi:MAG: alpha/beta fold hydrolase [Spirochaetaceae bacterium]|nr:alpha/beta fold hydrolase [Spirochaetaceae bacterium]